jgi:ligand-binding sensor domain-containing protein
MAGWLEPRGRALWLFTAAMAIGLSGCGKAKQTPRPVPPGWSMLNPPDWIAALVESGGTLYAGGKEGVWRVALGAGTATPQRLDCGVRFNYVRALAATRDGLLWIGHHEGLTRYDGHSCVTLARKDGLPDDRVTAVVEDHAGRLWVATAGGVVYRDNDRWQALAFPDRAFQEKVNVMLEDRSGGFWFGTRALPTGGIAILDRQGSWTWFRAAGDQLPHSDINALYEDRSGAIWAAAGFSDSGGAVRFIHAAAGWRPDKTLTAAYGLAGPVARSVYQDRHGALWFGSESDGLVRWSDGQFSRFTTENGLPDNEITCMLEAPDGALWIGTPGGLVRLASDVGGLSDR